MCSVLGKTTFLFCLSLVCIIFSSKDLGTKLRLRLIRSNIMSLNQDIIDEFVEKLRLEKFSNEQDKAEESLSLLEKLITNVKSSTARGYLNALCTFSSIMQAKMPWETTPLNMCQKVEKIVKDEYNSLKSTGKTVPMQTLHQKYLENLMMPDHVDDWDAEVDESQLQNHILEALLEQRAELEQCQELISLQGESKIHNDEIIMTCGYCPNVLAFLLRAAKKRKFHVIIAEGSPQYDAIKTAKSLSIANIQTTLIQDSTVFALMSRVNKVIIGCRTVSRNGGITTFVGASSMASAAKYYSVPVYVCTPTYKFNSEMAENLNVFQSPSMITPKNTSNDFLKDVNICVSKFDYVPPEKVTSFITNNRGIVPSYIYRHVMELYQPSIEEA